MRTGSTRRAPARGATIAGAVALPLLAAACGGSTPAGRGGTAAAATACPAGAHGDSASTSSYVVTLDVGPVEQMYSAQQAASSHPAGGEIMLRGDMDMMASGPDAKHLEAHICSRSTGAVVSDANPTILLRDTTAGSPAKTVPVAVMQGVSDSSSDLHYGNNVVLTPGHSFQVTVRLNGESATLPLSAG